jgi:hypothetical protein
MSEPRIAIDPIPTCEFCHHRKYTKDRGMVCGITNTKIPVKYVTVNRLYESVRMRAIPDLCPLPTYAEVAAFVSERIEERLKELTCPK